MAKQVTVQEAAELMKQGYKYLDVRSVPEFEAGHPEGALNIPLLHSQGGRMASNPDFQAVAQGNLPKDEKLLVGCKMGGRSSQAAAILEASGYTQRQQRHRRLLGRPRHVRQGLGRRLGRIRPPHRHHRHPRRHLLRAQRQEGLAA